MDESQIEMLAANLRRKDFLYESGATEKSATKNKHSKIDPIQLEQILGQLNELATREEGTKLLERFELSRKELERMAKLRKVHVTKDDNVERIKEKLIETIIGSRLSSRAIRGQ